MRLKNNIKIGLHLQQTSQKINNIEDKIYRVIHLPMDMVKITRQQCHIRCLIQRAAEGVLSPIRLFIRNIMVLVASSMNQTPGYILHLSNALTELQGTMCILAFCLLEEHFTVYVSLTLQES